MNIYEKALSAQSACNLSGLVHSFADALVEIWQEADKVSGGTGFVNRHPVSILFAAQISYLAGLGVDKFDVWHEALKVCEVRANTKP